MSDILAARAARTAGFRDAALQTVVAIGFAECSSYGPEDDASQATNDTRGRTVLPEGIDPEYSIGQWQINLLAHPELSEDDCRDYERAANIAYLLFRGRGNTFGDWSTYNGDEYKNYITRADIAIAATVPEGSSESALYTVAEGDTLSSIAEHFYGAAGSWPLIYNANAAQIGSDPDVIQIGSVLAIPPESEPAAGLAPSVEDAPPAFVDTGLAPEAPAADAAPHADAGAVGLAPENPAAQSEERAQAKAREFIAFLRSENWDSVVIGNIAAEFGVK